MSNKDLTSVRNNSGFHNFFRMDDAKIQAVDVTHVDVCWLILHI